MTIEAQPSKAMLWAGWILSLIPSLMLLSGALFAALQMPMVRDGMGKYGISPSMLPVMAAVELLCCVLYLIPWTAPIGAILMSAYMGGAVITHLRAGESQWVVPVVFGVIVWAGLLLRRPGLRREMLGW